HRLRAVGREHRILGGSRLDANLQALEILDLANLLLAVKATKALRSDPDDMDSLRSAIDHVPDGFEYFLVTERLDVVILRAEQEMQRHDTGLRRDRRGVRRRYDREVDVARFDQLKNLRLLPQLRARILIDKHRAFAQFLELGGK